MIPSLLSSPKEEQKRPGENIRPSAKRPGHGDVQITRATKEEETESLGSKPWPKLEVVFQ